MKSLIFGVGADDSSIQIDLDDPTPGSILVIGDSCAGKTFLLNAVAIGAKEIPLCSVYGITDRPKELYGIPGGYTRGFANCGGLLTALATRISPDQFPPVVLLIDGMDNLLESQRNNFIRLFDDGPKSCIWPLVTLNTDKITPSVIRWIGRKHMTTVFGRIANQNLAAELDREFAKIQLLDNYWFWTKGIGALTVIN